LSKNKISKSLTAPTSAWGRSNSGTASLPMRGPESPPGHDGTGQPMPLSRLPRASWVPLKGLVILVLLFFLPACVTVHDSADHRPPSERLSQLHSEGPRKRVLVLPFINETVEKDAMISKVGREALTAGLRQTDNFVIVDNQDIPKDLTTFQKDGKYDFEAISKLASQLGISAIIEGKVRMLRGHKNGDSVGLIRSEKSIVDAAVSLRAYAPVQHKEIMSETRSSQSESQTHRMAGGDEVKSALDPDLVHDAIFSAFQGMILPLVKAMDKVNWSGRIALINGDRIFLNAGKLTGINIGDILRVSDEGEDIFDPNTGSLIGQAPGRTKGTLEVISFFGKDGSVTIVHSGSGFKENDHVELY